MFVKDAVTLWIFVKGHHLHVMRINNYTTMLDLYKASPPQLQVITDGQKVEVI